MSVTCFFQSAMFLNATIKTIAQLASSHRLLRPAVAALSCQRRAFASKTSSASPLFAASVSPLRSLARSASGGTGSPGQGAAAAAAASNIVAIQDEADFDKRVRSAKQPVLLQFHATWCAPCKLLKPRLEKAVRSRQKLLLATVDVDNLPDVAAEYRVASVPMVLALREGRVVESFVGLREPEAVQDFVDSFAEKQGV